jgi:hypothetical protein
LATIALDLDSTLYDFATPARQAFLDLAIKHGEKEEYFKGGYQSWVEWRSPADVCGPEVFNEVLEIVHSPDVILAQAPYLGAQEVVTEVAEQHDIFYISNRSPDSVDATQEWLRKNDFPEANLIAMMQDKQPYLMECQYIIDDRAKTLVQFVEDFYWKYKYGVSATVESELPRKAFGLLHPYNKNLTDVPNIYLAPTWGGLEYYLHRKGVLSGEFKGSRIM